MALPVLPSSWVTLARDTVPALAARIESQIRAEVREYAGNPADAPDANLREAVSVALAAFVRGLSGRPITSTQHGELFRHLGRLEAQAGRSHDTMQMAYRVATLEIADHIAGLAARVGQPADVRADLRHAVITFIEHLATLSRSGYEEATVRCAAHEQAMTALVELLLGLVPPSRRIVELAAAAEWTVPDRVHAIEFLPEPLVTAVVVRRLRKRLGPALVVGRVAGRCVGFVAVGGASTGIAPMLAAALPAGIGAVLGPEVPLLDAARSARIAQRGGQRGAGPGVLDCDERLLDLFAAEAADVMVALAHTRLRPLAELGIVKRMKAAPVLAALLEYGGMPPHAAELADISPSTRQYRKAAVEDMFGDALRDRDRRVELLLALRAVLPQWEAELAMHERRASAKSAAAARRKGSTEGEARSGDRGRGRTSSIAGAASLGTLSTTAASP